MLQTITRNISFFILHYLGENNSSQQAIVVTRKINSTHYIASTKTGRTLKT